MWPFNGRSYPILSTAATGHQFISTKEAAVFVKRLSRCHTLACRALECQLQTVRFSVLVMERGHPFTCSILIMLINLDNVHVLMCNNGLWNRACGLRLGLDRTHGCNILSCLIIFNLNHRIPWSTKGYLLGMNPNFLISNVKEVSILGPIPSKYP